MKTKEQIEMMLVEISKDENAVFYRRSAGFRDALKWVLDEDYKLKEASTVKRLCESCKHEHPEYVIVCKNCYDSLMADSKAVMDLVRDNEL